MTATPSGRWIGRPELRREDRRFIRGEGRYVGTMQLPNTAHLVMVRSPLAHARLLGVDASSAARMPDVIAVLTSADLGPVDPMPVNPVEGADVMAIPPLPLAAGRVRFAGEAVAAVMAESRAAAEDAAEAVEVDYDPLPVVATVDDALRADAVVHNEAPDNVLLRWRRTGGDVEGAFADAAHVVRGRFEMPRLVAVPIETRGAVASYDADADLLTVWLSSQDTHRPLAQLAAMLGRPRERIRLIVPDVGGAFGSKGALATEAAVAAIASMRLGRPVRWVEDRSENFLAAYQGRGFRADAELAVDGEGRFLALRARIVGDLGAYLFPNTPAPPTTAAQLMIGAYATPAAEVEVVGVATNRVPTGPYRGAGRPEGAYVAERLADLAAAELGIDPAEIRRRNFIPPERFPYTTPLGLTYDSGEYASALDRACERIEYGRRRAEQPRARAEGRLVGIGLAVTIERAGVGLWESGAVRVEPGGDVVVRTGSSAHGQGHETTFSQVAAEVLDVDLDRVRVEAGDSADMPDGVGTFGSRSATVGGSAVLEAATTVRDEAIAIAAKELGVGEEAVTWRGGAAVAGERELSLREIVQAAGEPGLSAESRFTLPGIVFPYGAYAVAIEIDAETGVLRVERIVAVDDAGRLLNPLLAEGQVVGATVQGLGQSLFEEMVHDEDGQPLTGNLTLYAVPGATEVPPIESEFLETPSPLNPLGAKGVGESGSIALPAALANAVADALAPLGVTHLDPPYTPEKLWRAIRAAHSDNLIQP